MQRLHINPRLHRSAAAAGTKNIGSPALELRFPRGDLIGVDVEMLRQLSQCSIALDGGKRPLALKAGVWFRRGLLLIVSPDSRAQRARCQAETPLIVLCRFPRTTLSSDQLIKRALRDIGAASMLNSDRLTQISTSKGLIKRFEINNECRAHHPVMTQRPLEASAVAYRRSFFVCGVPATRHGRIP